MKKNNFIFYAFALILGVLTQTACHGPGEDCYPKIYCGINGTCLEGFCACTPGYTGTKCEIAILDSYRGHWVGKEWIDSLGLKNIDWRITDIPNKPHLAQILSAGGASIQINIDTAKFVVPYQTFRLDTIATKVQGLAYLHKDTIIYNNTYEVIASHKIIHGTGRVVHIP